MHNLVNTTLNYNETNFDGTQFELGLSFSILWALSIVYQLFFIMVVSKSAPKLVRVEFYILYTFGCISFFFSAVVILFYLGFYLNVMMFGLYTLIIVQGLLMNAFFLRSIILFYFSLYHLSFLKRTSLFQVISNLILKPRSFIIYMIIMSIYSLLVTSVGFYLQFLELDLGSYFSASIFNQVFAPKSFYLVIFHSIIPPLFSPIVYLTATIITCLSRIVMNISANNNSIHKQSEINRFRKNLKLFFKFFTLALINIVYIIPKMTYIMFFLSCNFCRMNLIPLNYFADIFTVLLPIFLLLIHNILRETLCNIFKR